MAATKFRDLRLSVSADVSQLERGFQAAEQRSARFERALRGQEDAAQRAERALQQTGQRAESYSKALKGQEDAAQRSEKALRAHEAQLKRSAAQMDAIGSSAARTRRLLEEATRRLPKLDVEADLSQPERQLAELTGRLRELSGMRLGIDISARDAQEKIAQVRRELMVLADQHPEVLVGVDVERAIAGLERVEREARKVDGRVSRIRVDVDGGRAAQSAISGIGQALTELGATATRGGPAAVAVALGALPGAALVAANGITVVLGGALAALGLAAAKGSDKAQEALGKLQAYAKAEAARMGEPFEQVWVKIVQVAERELSSLSPAVRRNLEALAPDVENFVDQAGASLEQLTPALDGIQRAFSAVLRELGPAMPEIMGHFANAITAITDAVEENPQVVKRMMVGLATLVDWAGRAIGELTKFADWLHDNAKAAAAFVAAMAPAGAVVAFAGMAAAESSRDVRGLGAATRSAADAAREATTIQEAAAQATREAWAQAYTSFIDIGQAVEQAKAKAAAQEKLVEASQRLAEVQRSGADKIRRAQADLALAHEQAAERVTAAQARESAARERAAEQAERSQARIRAAEEALAAAVEQSAQREQAAREGVEEARRRADEVAADSARSIEDSARRVADTQAEAAAREVAASRRVQDSHARTVEAVKDLEAAYASARRRVEELSDAQAEGATDEESAQIALARALERRDELLARRKAGDIEVSDLDLREAENSLERAEQGLRRVQKRNTELAAEIEQANRDGIEGSAEVVAAKGRIAEAQQAEQEAEAALAAQRAENARTIADAERALADTRARADRDREESERALARAEAELDQTRRQNAADVQRAQDDVAAATREAATAARDSAREIAAAQAEVAKAAKDSAREVAEAEDRVRQTRQDAAREAIAAGEAVRQAWADLRGDSGVTTQALLASLAEQVGAQERWAANMITLGGRVPDEIMEQLRTLGPRGAGLVEQMANMTDGQLRQFVGLMGSRGKEAGNQFAGNLDETLRVLREVARTHGQGVADQLRQTMLDRRTDVYAAAWELGLQVDRGLDLGRIRIVKIEFGALDELIREREEMRNHPANREIGGIDRYAAGGIRRPAAPMIASRPTILYGEGRGDEAFVPYDLAYRDRAESLVSQIADDFGGVFLKPQGALSMMPMPAPAAAPRGAETAVPVRGGVTIERYYASPAQDPRDIAEQFYLLSIARGY
ncbi:hypothetical protein Ssi03_76080 [Sphaerisporangium siamense]|uniref:Uncharacterized protein n=1 Tax=Sphaerisporangium siamense TaxID=795645 RepID=A0A7W7D3G7_9ACTN|nr:hypothetical protein [Sphaerisporangium siamense]MBB4699289.1 hypothetical protein [Sphaerisporangium siamense]GII89618.1 hypothetical protein Ssi03_76080 [Sphaerisporangium siamense]